MAEKIVRVRLSRVGTAALQATAESGGTAIIDGAPEIGGEGRGMRPMEALLMAIASCAAMDVIAILRKQKEPLGRLDIDVEGTRIDAVPAPYRRIEIAFVANEEVDSHKLERAVQLSVEKYCSVRASLDPAIEVVWTARQSPG